MHIEQAHNFCTRAVVLTVMRLLVVAWVERDTQATKLSHEYRAFIFGCCKTFERVSRLYAFKLGRKKDGLLALIKY
jgi:heme A synthase